jgi:ATP-dependent Clp endopeptidase proteolytic subunit ClpP
MMGYKLENKNTEDEDEEQEDVVTITLEDNHIYFYSEIDRTTIFKLMELLRQAEEYCVIQGYKLRVKIPIYLHINSKGGYVYDAYAAIDVIQSIQVPVYSIIEGATASAGTLISVSCKKRYIRPNAHILIHQISSGYWGKMDEIEDEMYNLKQMTRKIENIYEENTRLTKKQLKEILKHDLWFSSETAILFGLADKIFT